VILKGPYIRGHNLVEILGINLEGLRSQTRSPTRKEGALDLYRLATIEYSSMEDERIRLILTKLV